MKDRRSISKKILFRALAIALGTVAALIVAEVTLRFLKGDSYVRIGRESGIVAGGEWDGEKADRELSHPNVVFILLDAARADHFSCYGYGKNTTPRIDAISKKGVLFLRNYSPGPNTFLSLPGIFFSRYFSNPIFQLDGWIWGVREEKPETIFREFDEAQILLPEVLSKCGYRTAIFHNHDRFSKETYLLRKFDENFSFPVGHQKPVDQEIITAVLSWLQKNQGNKFFLYCHIMSPHVPYPPKEEDKEFIKAGELSRLEATRLKQLKKTSHTASGWSSEDLRYLRALYDGNLKHSDKWIGVLYEKLSELGLKNKTLFIVTADHGECLGEHNMLEHGDGCWNSVVHVPLIMVYPPIIPAGVRVEGLSESIDIMPTILDICKCGLPPGKTMDGVSLLEFIKKPESGKEVVFTRGTVQNEKYKFMDFLDGPSIFNIVKDPGETENLIDRKPEIEKELKTFYNQEILPLKERYQNARRTGSPDFSFYYPIHHFRFGPESNIGRLCLDTDDLAVLRKISPSKSWLFNRFSNRSSLFCLPTAGPPSPIRLTASLPDGAYNVSVLVESPQDFLKESGFIFRYNRDPTFLSPKKSKHLKGRWRGNYFAYLDLGGTIVKDEQFSLELAARPPAGAYFIIRHLKFDPVGNQQKEAPPKIDEDEIRQRRKNLKALGYL